MKLGTAGSIIIYLTRNSVYGHIPNAKERVDFDEFLTEKF